MFVESALQVSMMTNRYEINIHEIGNDFTGGIIFENDEYYVTASPLDHSLFDLGFRLQEKDRPGHLNLEKAQKYNLPMGPLIGELKKGNNITFNGSVIKPEDVLEEPIKGKSIAIVTDTKPCENCISLAKEADILIHEATFEKELLENAQEMKHSTTIDAAETAKNANAKLLIITHISSRNNDANKLVEECKSIFQNTIVAYDFLRVKI
jgi:ribonuclease Z